MLSGWTAGPSRVWAMLRKLEALLVLEQQTRQALEALNTRLAALESRMTYLEASEKAVVTEAKAAAGAAATMVASGLFSDVVIRLTRAEMTLDTIQRRLPSPPDNQSGIR